MFEGKACLNCHLVQRHGGRRGPELTYIADKLRKEDMIIRIFNGGVNMPAYGATLKPGEIDDLIAFLESRRKH
jgi:ubiquinol-cytochrome c reductase cytochrome b subunit